MPKKNDPQKIENILIFHPAGIGDAVLSIPAIKAIKGAHPKAYIALITSGRAKTLVELCPYVDDVFTIGMDAINNSLALLNGEKLSNVWKLLSKLRRRRFDVIADFTRIGSKFSAVKRAFLFSLIRGKHIVGRNTNGWGFFLDGKIFDPDKTIKHEVDHCIDIARLLGANSGKPDLELFLSDEDGESVDLLLRENEVQTAKTIVGINPNAFWSSKRWMKERFAAVADEIICNYDTQVVFVGGKSDVPLVEEIRSMMKLKGVNLAGKTGLRQLAALTERLDLLITNDSGPMHIAAAAKTPIVALFGPEAPFRYGPYCDKRKKVVIWKDIECSPCLKIECPDPKCMTLISVEEVLAGVERLLSI